MPTVFQLILTSVLLLICTYTDMETNTIMPILPLITIAIASLTPNKDYAFSLLMGVVGFLPTFIVNRFGKGGDGDALILGALGYTLPPEFFFSLYLLSYALYIIVLLITIIKTKDKKKQLPFVPFITSGYIATIMLYIINNNGGIII